MWRSPREKQMEEKEQIISFLLNACASHRRTIEQLQKQNAELAQKVATFEAAEPKGV